jgi:BirA family biotin operon repressor/biotin-[acetyl-CoA-carboxylase] ligase
MAEKLGVTRATVWKAVQSLRKDGYEIQAVTNTGYKLLKQNEIFDSKEIETYLRTRVIGRAIEYLEETGSTNEVAKERAKNGAPEGLTVIAERQTAGKGRYGRTFYSPQRGGIYMSVVFRPPWPMEETSYLTVMTAGAVCRAIRKTYCPTVEIKWVNDLYIDCKKLGGILTEAEFQVESAHVEYAVVGIGINVFNKKFPDEIADIVTNLCEHTSETIFVNLLIAEVMNELENAYLNEKKESVMDAYREASLILGKQIIFNDKGAENFGVAESIDEDGALIVKDENGRDLQLHAGEVKIRIKQ